MQSELYRYGAIEKIFSQGKRLPGHEWANRAALVTDPIDLVAHRTR
ncbi:hypothetical protein EPYR_00975 [Erwinia pyrifoliae DSM 12163]|nr:hypothetical protein EPYR_00975 [Erwinia pyrifoliae DSM 12163]